MFDGVSARQVKMCGSLLPEVRKSIARQYLVRLKVISISLSSFVRRFLIWKYCLPALSCTTNTRLHLL